MRVGTVGLVVLTALAVASVRPALAHDDGLTCHEHPSEPMFPFEEIKVGYVEFDLGPLGPGVLLHAFDNLAAAKIADGSNDFTRAEVVGALGGATEFAEMVASIRLLALRIDRVEDPTDQARAQRIAEDAFNRLPIASYLAFADFLAEARVGGAVQVDFEAFVGYLQAEAGVTTSLTSLMEDAMMDCG